jgi:hypothetical protein
VLIGNIPDNLFQNILERHEPHHFSVFVDHQSERGPAAAKSLELFRERPHLGDEPGWPRNCRDIDPTRIPIGGLDRTQHILHMQNPDDVFGSSLP